MSRTRLGLAGVAALSMGALIGGTTGTGEKVAFSPKTVTVGEGDGHAVVTVERDTCQNPAFFVQWFVPRTSTNDRGTASEGDDYTRVSAPASRWQPCEGTGSDQKVFTVPIIDDDERELDETVKMELRVDRTSTNQTLLPSVDPDGTIVIEDDDSPRLETPDVTVDEDAGVARVAVRLVNGPGEPATIGYSTEAGTAAAGTDFEAADDTVTADASGDAVVEISLVRDGGGEPDETFDVRFQRNEAIERATVTIKDAPARRQDEPKPQTQTTATTATTPAPPVAAPRSESKAVHRCVSKRRFALKLGGLRGAKVVVGGKRMKVAGGRATVDLRGNPKGLYTVRITGTDASGKKVAQIRRYRTCSPKKR